MPDLTAMLSALRLYLTVKLQGMATEGPLRPIIRTRNTSDTDMEDIINIARVLELRKARINVA
jgi:hypothetical protein